MGLLCFCLMYYKRVLVCRLWQSHTPISTSLSLRDTLRFFFSCTNTMETSSILKKNNNSIRPYSSASENSGANGSIVPDAEPVSAHAKPESVHTPESLSQRYRFIRKIGQGSQGKVFFAEKLDDHTGVAIKQLIIDSVVNWKAYDLFHREADVLSKLNIEGVAPFIEAIECLEDKPASSYIVQGFISGRSLGEMLNAGHRFSLDRVYDILLQLLDILEKLHTHVPPVIHRDVKPSNILMHPMGGDRYKVYLIDFGAVANPKVQGGGSTVAGTYGYMPPEQLTGKPCPESDIYSLAAVLVHLITGKSPATMPIKDFHLIFEPDMQNMPQTLVSTLRRMLEPNLELRLTDIHEIRRIFTSFKNAVYKIDSEQPVSEMSEEAYNEKLGTVETFGQEGNFELWQRLAEKTPRTVPAAYQNLDLLTKNRNTLMVIKNHNPYLISESEFLKKAKIKGGNYYKLQIFGIVCVVCAILRIIYMKTPVILTLLLFVLGVAIVCYCIAKMFILDNIDPVIYHIDEPQYVDNESIQSILKNGRKNVATIVAIEYVHAKGEYLQSYMRNKTRKLYIYTGNPLFKITYTFNPPDDAREEDIRHVCFTHIEPEGHYKVGDPLPILYQFYRKSRATYQTQKFDMAEYVESMPFPLPLDDIQSLSDIASFEEYMLPDKTEMIGKPTEDTLTQNEDETKENGIEF